MAGTSSSDHSDDSGWWESHRSTSFSISIVDVIQAGVKELFIFLNYTWELEEKALLQSVYNMRE